MSLHAPPVEILKRATTARRRRRSPRAHDVLRGRGIHDPLRHPARGVLLRLHRGRRRQPPAPVAARRRHPRRRQPLRRRDPRRRAGPASTPTGRSSSANASPAPCSPATSLDGNLDPTRDEDGWFATGDLGVRDESGGLRFLERAAESIRVKGEFVPIPFVEERLGTIADLADLALWKKPGELVDDEVVLYVVADAVPTDRSPPSQPNYPRSCAPPTSPRFARSRATPPRARSSAGAAHRGGAVVDPLTDRIEPARLGLRHGRPARPRRPQPAAAARQRRARPWPPRRPSASASSCSSRTRAPPWSVPRPPMRTASTAGSC